VRERRVNDRSEPLGAGMIVHMRVLVLAIVMTATAHADGLPTAGHLETVIQLTATARNLARDGRCEALPGIAARVQALDEDYYSRVYLADPAIIHCTPIDPRLQMSPPPSLTRPRPSPYVGPPPPAKSATTATLLSLGVTAAGLAMVDVGNREHISGVSSVGAILFFIGPTSGHTYAGHTWNSGLGMRLVGMGSVFVGGMFLLSCIDGCDENNSLVDAGFGLALGGAVLYAFGGIYEISTAGEEAHRYNHEHGIEATLVPTGRGLAIAGRF
jgi:hypothetical protein